jgi:serine/threonine protein kinase
VVDAALDVLAGLERIHSLDAIHRDIGSATIIQAPDYSQKSIRYIISDTEFVIGKDEHGTDADFAYLALKSSIENYDYEMHETFQRSIDYVDFDHLGNARQLVLTDHGSVAAQDSISELQKLIQAAGSEEERQALLRAEQVLKDLNPSIRTEASLPGTPGKRKAQNRSGLDEETPTLAIWLPENMAPEIWPCVNTIDAMKKPDQTSDLWSVGVLLFHMTTGSLPFMPKDDLKTLMPKISKNKSYVSRTGVALQ